MSYIQTAPFDVDRLLELEGSGESFYFAVSDAPDAFGLDYQLHHAKVGR